MKLYDPRTDIIFRKIFGEHKNLCMSLLNSLLPLGDDEKIVSLEYGHPDMLPESPEMKNSIVDVRCTDAKGRSFIAEMQMYWTDSFLMRTLLNTCKAFVSQLHKGKPYQELQPVYALCLLNDNMPSLKKFSEEYSHVFRIMNERHTEIRIGGLMMVFVELNKFKTVTGNRIHRKLADLWLSFLTMLENNDGEVIPKQLLENSDTAQAVECLENMSLSEEERRAYDKYWDAISYQKTLILGKYDDGKKEGEEIGEKRGIEIGEKEGVIEIARNMLAMGLSLGQIATATGLSLDEVEKL